MVSEQFLTDTAELRRHRAARDDPARAARHHVLLGPLLRHAEHPRPSSRWARRCPTPSCSARLAARMGFDDEQFRLYRRGAAGARRSTGRTRDGGHHRSTRCRRDGLGAAQPPAAPTSTPRTPRANFPTPSGKTEFRSSALEAAGNFVVPLFRQGYERVPARRHRRPAAALHRAARDRDERAYPLNLLSPKSHAYINSSAGDQATAERVQGEQSGDHPPRRRRGARIAEGATSRCPTTAASSSRSRGLRRGRASASSCARWARGRSTPRRRTVNAVNAFRFADLGNAPTFSDTRVEVTPV